jgi:hypothetical protein
MKKAIKGNTIVFTFGNDVPELVFDATKAAQVNRAYAEMHGWSGRLGDAAAIPREQKDGSVITVTEAMRREAIAELAAHYEGGSVEWNMKGSARAPVQNAAIAGLAAKMGLTYTAAEAYIANINIEQMSHPERTSL